MEEITQNEFGKILKEFRKKKGLTQKEIAEKIHVAQNTVSKWEDGTLNPGFLNIYNLCRVFNITLDEFLGLGTKKFITFTVSQGNIEKFHSTIREYEEALNFIFPNQDSILHHKWAEHKRFIELFLLNAE